MTVTEREYVSFGDEVLKVDVFRSVGPSQETAVLLLHGGGWRVGERTLTYPYARHLAARGYTAIAVEYRLTPVAPWPAQLEDVLSAVEWVRANASELGVRPERVVLEGFSAGGHLALLAASRTTWIAAVIAFFAPSRLAVKPRDSSEIKAEMLLGANPSEKAADEASPIEHLGPDFPPTFLLHGTGDWLISHQSSMRMFDTLVAAGVNAELHIYGSEHHEFCAQPSSLGPVQDEVVNFLRRTVVDPTGHAQEAAATNMFAKGPEYLAEVLRKG